MYRLFRDFCSHVSEIAMGIIDGRFIEMEDHHGRGLSHPGFEDSFNVNAIFFKLCPGDENWNSGKVG